MSLDIEIVELQPTHTVVLSRRVRQDVLAEVIGPAIDRAMSLVAAARVTASGPPFVRYLSLGDEVEAEVGVPTCQPESAPALRSSMLPGGTALTTWHVSGLADLPATLDALTRWIEEHGAVPGRPWQWHWPVRDDDPPLVQVVWPLASE